MKYYLIVGEASGDLHASRLMRSLKTLDKEAQFRFFGGDLMKTEGGDCVRHYKEIAYMGFVPVFMHLRTILNARRQCKKDILQWNPDVVIFVDYAGFNLNVAKYLNKVRQNRRPALYYYISPKIWAWKEHRIGNFKRDIDEMFCIMPFEVPFFEQKHGYRVNYVGNPTANEVAEFRASYTESFEDFCLRNNLDNRPVIALLAGSRHQEIKDNLRMMISSTAHLVSDYQLVLAGAPSIDASVYMSYIKGTPVKLVQCDTYPLLAHATAALVTSGTATLETCCFNVPQVVLYKTPFPRLARLVWDNFFKVKYISLVNLIADSEIVQEMMAEKFEQKLITAELNKILPGQPERTVMLDGYAHVHRLLGHTVAPDNAASVILQKMKNF